MPSEQIFFLDYHSNSSIHLTNEFRISASAFLPERIIQSNTLV